MPYDWEAIELIDQEKVLVDIAATPSPPTLTSSDRESGLISNPIFGHSTTPTHPGDCPCPGHTCSGNLIIGSVSGTVYTEVETRSYHYEFGWILDDTETLSDSATMTAATADRDSYKIPGDTIRRCWPSILITGAGSFPASIVLEPSSGQAIGVYASSEAWTDDVPLPLTAAQPYTITGSGTETVDEWAAGEPSGSYGDSATRTITTITWSFSVTYAVHSGLL